MDQSVHNADANGNAICAFATYIYHLFAKNFVNEAQIFLSHVCIRLRMRMCVCVVRVFE